MHSPLNYSAAHSKRECRIFKVVEFSWGILKRVSRVWVYGVWRFNKNLLGVQKRANYGFSSYLSSGDGTEKLLMVRFF